MKKKTFLNVMGVLAIVTASLWLLGGLISLTGVGITVFYPDAVRDIVQDVADFLPGIQAEIAPYLDDALYITERLVFTAVFEIIGSVSLLVAGILALNRCIRRDKAILCVVFSGIALAASMTLHVFFDDSSFGISVVPLLTVIAAALSIEQTKENHA